MSRQPGRYNADSVSDLPVGLAKAFQSSRRPAASASASLSSLSAAMAPSSAGNVQQSSALLNPLVNLNTPNSADMMSMASSSTSWGNTDLQSMPGFNSSQYTAYPSSSAMTSLSEFRSGQYTGLPSTSGTLSSYQPPESSSFHTRLTAMCQSVQSHVRSPLSDSLVAQLRDLGFIFGEHERALKFGQETIMRERENIRSALTDNQRLLSNALAERDRACRDRDEAISQMQKLQLVKHSQERLRDVETNLKKTNAELLERIKVQDDQINGKKSLWLESHKKSSQRDAQQSRDPYTTPSGQHVSARGLHRANIDVSTARNLLSDFEKSFQAPTTSSASLLGVDLPHGRPKPAPEFLSGQRLSSPSVSRAERGHSLDVPSSSTTMAMVPFRSEDDVASDFVGEIAQMWRLAEDWARKYASAPNSLATDQQISTKPALWQYMLALSYVDEQDARNHTVVLLRDEKARMFFVMRMIISYVCQEMWVIRAYEGHDSDSTKKVHKVAKRLMTKGLSTVDRAQAISIQCEVVHDIMAADDYAVWRVCELEKHTKGLRELLGPMLNTHAERAKAGPELGAMTLHAFDLASKMLTSGWSFQFQFPECGGKFMSNSMVSRDAHLQESAMQLQIRQVRVKLVMTPVVTMRDDRGVAIRVKQLHSANVLVMA